MVDFLIHPALKAMSHRMLDEFMARYASGEVVTVKYAGVYYTFHREFDGSTPGAVALTKKRYEIIERGARER